MQNKDGKPIRNVNYVSHCEMSKS